MMPEMQIIGLGMLLIHLLLQGIVRRSHVGK